MNSSTARARGRIVVGTDAVLDEACQGCRPHNVRTFVMEGDPVNCLLEHATGADLLVLGDRGAGGFLGLQLGSVASTFARSATCAVLIVPTSRERRTARARTAVGALR
jgi:nucleotide-binding universal stress UspA family protein